MVYISGSPGAKSKFLAILESVVNALYDSTNN